MSCIDGEVFSCCLEDFWKVKLVNVLKRSDVVMDTAA